MSSKKAENYESEILLYLKAKYNENFIIDDMTRQTDIGLPSVIVAKAYSERFPEESFDVNYHLSFQDIDNKEEVIEFLKEMDVYDESKLKTWDEDVEPYFEDNYANVIFQNQYDEAFCDFDATYVKTMIETTNYFSDATAETVTLEEYLDSESNPVYTCNMIFVDEKKVADKQAYVDEIVRKLARKTIERQFIYIHFTDKDKDFLENEFYANYDDAVKYFMDAPYLTDYIDVFLKDGQKQ